MFLEATVICPALTASTFLSVVVLNLGLSGYRARESKVPESRHTNLIEPHWKGQEINAARQFNA